MVRSAAAGSGTTSSTPWQSTTSAEPGATCVPMSVRSPWTPVTRPATPASSARRARAASASGLGSTTVTAWPSRASRTANPPVPPPMSTTRAFGSSRATTASQTTPVRTLVRRSLVDMAPSLGARTIDRSSRAPRAAVPQLAGDGLGVVAGRLDVGVRRHLEPAGVHQHPACAPGRGCRPRLLPDSTPRHAGVALGHPGEVLVHRGQAVGRARSRAAPAAPRRRWRAGRRRGDRYDVARRGRPAARSRTRWPRTGPGHPRRTSRRPGRCRRRG